MQIFYRNAFELWAFSLIFRGGAACGEPGLFHRDPASAIATFRPPGTDEQGRRLPAAARREAA
jgi:hypothetical protein